jgi:hypothetical protein
VQYRLDYALYACAFSGGTYVHGMLPYSLVRQTLKVGNVATMISGIMRIVLAKVSVSAVTNWIGLSSGADEGMNLLQQ